MKKIATLLLFVIYSITQSQGQSKTFEDREMAWLGYFNQTRFTNKSGLWVDLHLRMNDDFIKEVHTTIARAAYIHYITNTTRLSFGYAYQNQPGHDGALEVKHHGPWQQIQWFEKKSWFTMMQWIRLEQRFRKSGESDYEFSNHRIRYSMAFTIPLTNEPRTPFIFTNNEVFINLGKNIVNNYFDQNRFFVGLGYQFSPHFNVQAGYLNVFQQLPAGNKYVNADAIRLFVFHSLDFRPKESDQKP